MKKYIIGAVAVVGLALAIAPAQALAAYWVPAVPAVPCAPAVRVAPVCAPVAPVVTYGQRGWYRGGNRVYVGHGHRAYRAGYRAHFHGGHYHRR